MGDSERVHVVVETPASSRNPRRVLDQIEHFFIAYNRYEGLEFVPLRRRGPQAAQRALEKAIRAQRRS